MAYPHLKMLAEDLEKILADIKPKPVVKPSVTVEQDLTQVARAVFEYVLHRAPEDATAEAVGAALSIGVESAAAELGLDEQTLFKAVDTYVCHALRAAQSAIER